MSYAKNKLYLGLLLALVMLLQVLSTAMVSKQNTLYSREQNLYFDLVHWYNIFHACASKLKSTEDTKIKFMEFGWSDHPVKQYPNIYNSLSEDEKKKYDNKVMHQFWYDECARIRKPYEKADENARNATINLESKTKALRKKRETYRWWENFFNITSLALLAVCIFSYHYSLENLDKKMKNL
ncbi:MAG: hypothetical protein JW867_00445 [Candidatus Omnitrophica bacterium]|nr:hypothetical protein [Candidatus Omnitrophota bacterium]